LVLGFAGACGAVVQFRVFGTPVIDAAPVSTGRLAYLPRHREQRSHGRPAALTPAA